MYRCERKYLTFMLLLTTLFKVNAQIDTEFWFVAPDIAANYGESPLTLVLSSAGEASKVVLSQPANPSFTPMSFSLNRGEVKIIDLSPYLDRLENRPANLKLQYGLLLTSDRPVLAYYQVSSPPNAAIFTWKGRDALGKEFYIPAQSEFRNQHGSSAFDMVATEDSTTINIRPSTDIVGHPKGEEFKVVLDRGETYSCRETRNETTNSLAGSYILADKAVAVTYSDDAIFNEAGTASDLVGDQLLPVRLMGTEYIAVKAEAETERLYVTATEDGTTLEVDGAPLNIILDAGETTFIEIENESLFLKASSPVYVWHMTGYLDQPAGALLSPLNCTGIRLSKYVRDASENFITYLVSRAEHVEGFRLNGTSNLVPSYFSAVPGTNGEWMAARIEAFGSFAVSTNQISNTSGPFHMNMITYYGESATFAAFSDASPLVLPDTRLLCENDSLILDAGPNQEAYLWSTGDTQQQIQVSQPGTYWVETDFAGCSITDTVQVIPADLSLKLGKDTTICEGDSLVISLDRTAGIYTWDDGLNAPRKVLREAGQYTVALEVGDCVISDTISVDIQELPGLELGNDTVICRDTSFELDVSASGATYRWQDGTKDATFTVVESGTYRVVRNLLGCTQQDSIQITESDLPQSLGRDTTICLGDTLVLRLRKENVTYLWDDGETDHERVVSTEGIVTVSASDPCGQIVLRRDVSLEDCSCKPLIPNVFTPNADGFHDRFLPELNCPLSDYELMIFDKWGNTLFRSTQPGQSWDGKQNGNQVAPGVYFWSLQYQSEQAVGKRVRKGVITLMR